MNQATLVEQVDQAARREFSGAKPNWAAKSGVAKAAERCIHASPYFALRSITCDCDKGVLVLKGRVPSYYLKQLAQESVRKVDGVRIIVNVIKVSHN